MSKMARFFRGCGIRSSAKRSKTSGPAHPRAAAGAAKLQPMAASIRRAGSYDRTHVIRQSSHDKLSRTGMARNVD